MVSNKRKWAIVSGISLFTVFSMIEVRAGEMNPAGFVATSSEVYSGREAVYAVNGAGMNGEAHDSNTPVGKMWQCAGETNVVKWFKVDLASSVDLDYMKIYNYNWNNNGTLFTDRGCREVQVFYSDVVTDPGNPVDNSTNWTALGSAFELAQAPGDPTYGDTHPTQPAEVNLDVTARWVAITSVTNWGGGAYHGLSEVRFWNTATSNQAPFFTDNAMVGNNGEVDTAYVGSISGSAVDYDIGDSLSYSKSSGPAWLNVAVDGVLSGNPTAGDLGLNMFTVAVSDGNGGSDTATLEITVDVAVNYTLINSSGFTATAESVGSAKRQPVNVVNGSGMTGDAHDNGGDNQIWQSAGGAFPKWFKVDMGIDVDLSVMQIYNCNWAGQTSRGCREVEIFYSNAASDPGNPVDNATNWTAHGTSFELTQAPGADDYGTTNPTQPDLVELNLNARWLALKINTAYSSVCALSEVRFFNTRTNNAPPGFIDDPIVGANGEEAFPYSGTISGSAIDIDVGDTLTYSKTAGPAWLNVDTSGALSGTPTAGDVGLNSFTIEVLDDNGGSDTTTLEITVEAATQIYTLIDPLSLSATAESSDGTRLPIYAVNGAGMIDDSHINSPADNQMWQSAGGSFPKWFKVDLAQSYDLGYMKVYNFNWVGQTSRGCREVEIFYSNAASDPGNPVDNSTNWTALGTAFELTQAPGANDYGTTNPTQPDLVELAVTARWVSFKINTAFSSRCGLSEVRFWSATSTLGGYELWAGRWDTDIGATTNDYDGDGLDNIYECGFGGDPTNGTIAPAVLPTFGYAGGGMQYIHPVRTDDIELDYTVETTIDLVHGSWTNEGYAVTGTNVTGGVLDFVTNDVYTVDDEKFIRIRIE